MKKLRTKFQGASAGATRGLILAVILLGGAPAFADPQFSSCKIFSDLPVAVEMAKRQDAVVTGGQYQSQLWGNTGSVDVTASSLAKIEKKIAALCQKPNARDATALGKQLTELGQHVQFQDENLKYVREHAAKVARAWSDFGYAQADACKSQMEGLYSKYAPRQDLNRQKLGQLTQQLNKCASGAN